MKHALFAFASVLVLGASTEALAASACLDAADKGQDLRSAGKLDEARAMFLVCAKPTCNRVVRSDCARWIEEIDKEKAARAEVEGKEKADKREQKPSSVPPVPAPSHARMTLAVTDAATSSPVGEAATFPVAPVVLGGIGVISLAAFGYFQVQGWSRYASLEEGCARTQSCTDADIEGTRSQFVASGAALGVSVVSLGVAALLYFTRGGSSSPLRLGVRPGGAAVSF
jgi:hypothetical protein